MSFPAAMASLVCWRVALFEELKLGTGANCNDVHAGQYYHLPGPVYSFKLPLMAGILV